KFFYIENVSKLNWIEAASTCRMMGGQLADINDEEEYNGLKARVVYTNSYWLGISDQAKDGEFISLSSGKPATFLEWQANRPHYNDSDHCVALYMSKMWDDPCSREHNFICQTD
ncbi:hypothetical protein KR084_003013, partial [Drosophila pseudotakahashii]